MREACGVFDYTDPKGKKCVPLANVVSKFEVEGGIDAFIAEAEKHGIEIPEQHLAKSTMKRGRPAKVATADTTPASSRNASDADSSDAESETAKPKKQQRKKVVKTADADAAPKKRGRPAKAKEPTIEATDDLIASLASDAQSSSGSLTATPRVSTPAASARTPSAAAQSTPRKVVQVTEEDDELTEDEVEVVATPKKSPAKPAAAPAAPKKLAAAKPKRKEITINGDKYWVEKFVDEDGDEQTINVRCSDNSAFQDEDYVGVWNNATRTLEVD
jgi:hypothetical protein